MKWGEGRGCADQAPHGPGHCAKPVHSRCQPMASDHGGYDTHYLLRKLRPVT